MNSIRQRVHKAAEPFAPEVKPEEEITNRVQEAYNLADDQQKKFLDHVFLIITKSSLKDLLKPENGAQS
jgi:hypothetical protein